jgi:hypothetical protein
VVIGGAMAGLSAWQFARGEQHGFARGVAAAEERCRTEAGVRQRR